MPCKKSAYEILTVSSSSPSSSSCILVFISVSVAASTLTLMQNPRNPHSSPQPPFVINHFLFSFPATLPQFKPPSSLPRTAPTAPYLVLLPSPCILQFLLPQPQSSSSETDLIKILSSHDTLWFGQTPYPPYSLVSSFENNYLHFLCGNVAMLKCIQNPLIS